MKSALKTFLAIALFVALVPTVAFAEQQDQPEKKQSVAITIGNDFYTAGNAVALTTDAEDDAFLAGAIVNATKKVAQDLFAAGSSVNILADVGDDLRAAGSMISVASKIGGDALIGGGVVNFTENAAVGGDAALAGGMLNFSGSVAKNLQLAGDEINFAGTVGGDATIRVGKKITFIDGAKIVGKLTLVSKNKIAIPDGLAGSVEEKTPSEFAQFGEFGKDKGLGWMGELAGKLFFLLVGLVTGAVLLALFGRSSEVFASKIKEKFWWSLLAGTIALVVPIVSILLAITIVGSWLAAILGLMWVAGLLAAGSLVGFAIGSLFVRQKADSKYGRKLLALVLGWLIFVAVGFIPGFGGLLQFTIFVLTLGAGVLTDCDLYKKMKKAKLL
ncbi:MAG: hypothetical protein V2A63_03065 [Patescibacteria group bacterium]